VFITYPTAADLMTGSNFWVVTLGFTLFMLGIDSAFSLTEAYLQLFVILLQEQKSQECLLHLLFAYLDF